MLDRRTLGAILLLTFIGMGVLLYFLMLEETREKRKAVERKGYHFTSLLALHTVDEFKNERRDFLLRSFLEHPLFQDLAYFYIHELDGPPVIALNHSDFASRLPPSVQNKALQSMVFEQQSVRIDEETHLLEFSKPVFENGIRTGTVRLGLFKPEISIISLERISLLAMLAFFIFAGALTVYYGFSKTLMTLSSLKASILSDSHDQTQIVPDRHCDPALLEQELSEAMQHVKDRLCTIEDQNTELTARIGLVQYEKAQVGKILDSIHLGIIITDIHAKVVHLNNYVLNLFGIDRSESIDRTLDEILHHPEALEFIARDVPSGGTDGDNGIAIEFQDLAPGVTYHLTCSYFADCKDRPSGKMILLRNSTRERALEQATRDFTAHLSHELLTPLSTIQSYSEMLVDDEIDDVETRNEFYNTIHGETARLSRLIKDILTFSRLENGNMTIEKGLVRSDWLYSDSLDAVTGSALKKNITIENILPDNAPSLIGDKEQLKGAIINILGNAVKYTPEGGTIHFELSEADDMVTFDIKDDGCGIPRDEIPHIFNKFFRSSNPAVADQPGTGLGLAIAHEIVMLHEGKLDVESRVGEGSQFTLKIPKEEYTLEK